MVLLSRNLRGCSYGGDIRQRFLSGGVVAAKVYVGTLVAHTCSLRESRTAYFSHITRKSTASVSLRTSMVSSLLGARRHDIEIYFRTSLARGYRRHRHCCQCYSCRRHSLRATDVTALLHVLLLPPSLRMGLQTS